MKQTSSFYTTEGIDTERFLILSDLQQAVPQTRLKVVGRELRTNKDGREYPTLRVQDEEGNIYTVAAWKRDCRDLIKQWGGEPLDWGYFLIKRGTHRFELDVAFDQTTEEEIVKA
jgi:hypothetical protein